MPLHMHVIGTGRRSICRRGPGMVCTTVFIHHNRQHPGAAPGMAGQHFCPVSRAASPSAASISPWTGSLCPVPLQLALRRSQLRNHGQGQRVGWLWTPFPCDTSHGLPIFPSPNLPQGQWEDLESHRREPPRAWLRGVLSIDTRCGCLRQA